MLQYRRRNSTEPVPTPQGSPVHALVSFCNYSYDRSGHVNTSMLRSLLSSFNESYIHLYLRLFNEANPALIRSFMEHEHISRSNVLHIYHILNERGYDLRDIPSLL